MSPLIHLKNLSVHYQKFQALKNLSFTLEEGCIGLLGPNGAGKSTLIKTLLGLLPVTTGEVEILGQHVQAHPLSVRAKIGYVPEGDAYLPHISAVQFVAFLGELSGMQQKEALKRAHEVLEYVGLGEERYRKLEDLSHGQRSRIKLAQALAHKVELLILDEPTDGMDPGGRDNFLSLIRRIREHAKLSILLASHTLEDVESLCEKVVMIQNGEVLAIKKLSELLTGQEKNYMVELAGDVSQFLATCEKEGIKTKAEQNKVLLYNIGNPQIIFRMAYASRTATLAVYPWRPTLESMFVEMICKT